MMKVRFIPDLQIAQWTWDDWKTVNSAELGPMSYRASWFAVEGCDYFRFLEFVTS